MQPSGFLLGTHMPTWLKRTNAPLFLSRNALARLPRHAAWPTPACSWYLDSGGFTELSRFGGWSISAKQYVAEINHFTARLGPGPVWCAPQDWMCEPIMIRRTGLDVAEHQRRTVHNFLELTTIAPHIRFIPVVQGWTMEDYIRCVELYGEVGVDLRTFPLVGVGSVCRRQSHEDIHTVFKTLHTEYGLQMHGFGVKTAGLNLYGRFLVSADSLAWSFIARVRRLKLQECQHKGPCNNCLRYALTWRDQLIKRIFPRHCDMDGIFLRDFTRAGDYLGMSFLDYTHLTRAISAARAQAYGAG